MSVSISIRSAVKYGTGTVASGSIGYSVYKYQTDEGIQRAFEFYKALVPVVVHYRWSEFIGLDDPKAWEELDEKYAIPTVAKLGELQGMFVKYAQSAAGFTNTFGTAWINEFRKLENQVPPRHIDAIYQTIREETGRSVGETFTSFDETPLGSASIGQVHRATLIDGRPVAVKVQYAEAQELFQEDIHTIRAFCETFAPEHVVLLDAIEKQNAAELNYHNEATNLKEISQNMMKHGFQPNEVCVPKPLPEYTTHRMLVMELLPGPKLIDGVRDYFAGWAQDHGTTLQQLEQQARKTIETCGFPAKYTGPSAWQIGLYRRYLQARDSLFNVCIGVYNTTAGRLIDSNPVNYQSSSLPPNIPRMVDTLMRVHGYQLLKDGVFNAGKSQKSVPLGCFLQHCLTSSLLQNEQIHTAETLYCCRTVALE